MTNTQIRKVLGRIYKNLINHNLAPTETESNFLLLLERKGLFLEDTRAIRSALSRQLPIDFFDEVAC